jgi:aspartate/methionine/tyrosine aminotransferase
MLGSSWVQTWPLHRAATHGTPAWIDKFVFKGLEIRHWHHPGMRPVIAALPASKIREVANAGLGRSDVLAFWFGESDEVPPAVVSEAAIASLRAGETFYSHNLGLPELREALAVYLSGLHAAIAADRIAVTSSGVSALMIASQLLLDAGDEVVTVVPVWPNISAQPAILGATVRRVPLRVQDGAWVLDMPALLAAITPQTRAVYVNAPNNPTGWTLSREEQQTLLAHCRRTGTWIVADEVYERVYFETGWPAAPSFLDIADPQDRLIVAHSFSKSFLMTGWRLGWLVLPPGLAGDVAKLIEFNTSCAPVFVQRAGLAALQAADAFVPGLVQRLKGCRDTLIPRLAALPRVSVATPQGGLYAFFRVAGEDDSLAFAKRLVEEVGLGLAPGIAFGVEAEGWLRWCFASRDPARLVEGVGRLSRALGL